jgi:hypothetical protein
MGIESVLKFAPALVGSLFGNSAANSAPSQQTVTQQNQLDPRIAAMLFGSGQGTKKLKAGAIPRTESIDGTTRQVYAPEDYETVNDAGLLGRYQGMLDQPMSPTLQKLLGLSESSLGQNFASDQDKIRSGISQLMQGNQSPQMQYAQSQIPQSMVGATGAPVATSSAALASMPQVMQAARGLSIGQNNIDLSDPYNSFLSGELGNNPYLTGAIQKGINQSSAAFQNLQSDATRNMIESILPNIRGGAIASGQYGGSRQGISESKATNDFSTQIGRALSQVGQNNVDAAIAAQAGAYNQDQANRLNALNSLSGNQFQQLGQNTSNQQAANLANYQGGMQNAQFNAGNQNQMNLANAGARNQMNLANLGNMQQANQLNYQGGLQNAQFNAGNMQQANQANLNAQMGTNQLNQAGLLSGMSGLSGLGSTNYNIANQLGDYNINRAQQVNNLLSPYLSANSSSTQSQPLYTNRGANILGGALQGIQIGNQLGNLFSGSNTSNPSSFMSGFGSSY